MRVSTTVEFLGFIPLSPGGEGPWCPLAVILTVAISIGLYPFDILVFITLSGRFFEAPRTSELNDRRSKFLYMTSLGATLLISF